MACPLTPKRMLTLPPEVVYRKIIQTGRLAQKLGARILGLGAFTSVVGDGGVTISRHLDIPVTTGDSYTVSIAVGAVREAARQMGIDLKGAQAAVVGATGKIGSVCAEILGRDVPKMLLIGRRQNRLAEVREKVLAAGCQEVRTSSQIEDIRQADLVLTVTSALDTIIDAHHLKSGAVVCDVSRPRDVSREVAEMRDDVLVIEGGIVEVPGQVDFHFDFGFPPGKAYACIAETMILALERRYESFSLGRQITLEKVEEITRLAEKHGFRLAGFRSFEREVTPAQIERIRENARRRKEVARTPDHVKAQLHNYVLRNT